MKILGIDPGYERLGIAVIEKPEVNATAGARGGTKEMLLYSDCFKTSKDLEFSERIGLIGAEIDRLIEKFSPELLAIETLFFNKNVKTAMNVAEVRGVLLEKAVSHGMQVREFNPLQIKNAVAGSGRADKKQVILMIPKLISMEGGAGNAGPNGAEKKRHDDEYDAIAVALTCSASEKFNAKTAQKLSTSK